MHRLMLLGIILLASTLSATAEPYKTLRLTAQQQHVLQTKHPVKRSAIGSPKIASLKVLNSREFLITAKQYGSTSLLLWQGDGNPTEFRIEVIPALSPNISQGVVIDAQGEQLILEGTTSSLQQHQQLLKATGPKVIDNTQQTGSMQVQTDIKIIEYSRSQLKQIGTSLAYIGGDTSIATGSTGLLPVLSGSTGPLGALLGNVVAGSESASIMLGHATGSFRAAISALQQNGYAYTLAEPSLVAMSGHTASFIAGGEFPYPTSNRDGQVQIEFKEFGVRLNLTPTVLSQNSIMLKVAPEVSDLDFDSGVESGGAAVPLIRVRRTDTVIQLAPGESFIISGLISRSTFNNADRVPGLGDIPILGALFRSSRFQQDDKELLMIVTPHLVKPLAKGAELPELPGETYRHYTPSYTDMLFGNSVKNSSKDLRKPKKANVGFAN